MENNEASCPGVARSPMSPVPTDRALRVSWNGSNKVGTVGRADTRASEGCKHCRGDRRVRLPAAETDDLNPLPRVAGGTGSTAVHLSPAGMWTLALPSLCRGPDPRNDFQRGDAKSATVLVAECSRKGGTARGAAVGTDESGAGSNGFPMTINFERPLAGTFALDTEGTGTGETPSTGRGMVLCLVADPAPTAQDPACAGNDDGESAKEAGCTGSARPGRTRCSRRATTSGDRKDGMPAPWSDPCWLPGRPPTARRDTGCPPEAEGVSTGGVFIAEAVDGDVESAAARACHCRKCDPARKLCSV